MERPKKESQLFHSLNKFITIISNGNGPQSNPHASAKTVSNFLRLNLLSYLRQHNYTANQKNRDVLTQWWITLLNYLNSDLQVSGDQPQSTLNIDTISVSLECISRIITATMVLPTRQPMNESSKRDLSIYSHHLMLTIHYITNRLIANSKKKKPLPSSAHSHPTPPSHLRSSINFINNYNSLLRSFIGKVIAFSFFYLDESLDYDTNVLKFFQPATSYVNGVHHTVFCWKTKNFILSTNKAKLLPNINEKENFRLFQVMISYLQNDNVFMTFYWHYWYIVIKMHVESHTTLTISAIPGLSILTSFVESFLDKDFSNYLQYLKCQEREIPQQNSGGGGGDNTHVPTKPNGGSGNSSVTSEKLNNFIYTKFRTIKMWECLRSLAGCFESTEKSFPVIAQVIALHDKLQLKTVSKIPAYDSMMANLIYNKILQFILFQFATKPKLLKQLQWDVWIRGILGMLQTLNVHCQSVSLLCLFNIWKYIPNDSDPINGTDGLRSQISIFLIEKLWDSLTVDNDFHIVRVLFVKLIVFQVLGDPSGKESRLLYDKLQQMYEQTIQLSKTVPCQDDDFGDVLVFQGNKKLILFKNDRVEEDDLMYGEIDKGSINSTKSTLSLKEKLYFSSVITISSVRPSFVLLSGKYPFDVFDEMVSKAAMIVAEKRKKLQRAGNPEKSNKVTNSSTSSFDSRDSEELPEDPSKQKGLLSNALGSFFSKLNHKAHRQVKRSGSTQKLGRISDDSRRDSAVSTESDDATVDSESTEMLSMYSTVSTVSSLTTSRSGSSEELFNRVQRSTTNSSSQRQVSTQDSQQGHQQEHQQEQKKRKLMAPPELKFSVDISKRCNITHIFRLVVAPITDSNGLPSSISRKIQEANDKWGVVTSRNYDKPLPTLFDQESETLLDGFDFESLSPSLDDLQTPIINSQPEQHSREQFTPKTCYELPKPDVTILRSCLMKNSKPTGTMVFDNDDLETLHRLSLSEERPASPSITDGVGTVMDEDSDGNYQPGVSQIFNKTCTTMMYRTTKLSKLVKIIKTFNSTVQELQDYMNVMDGENGGNERIFMEFEVGGSNTPFINAKNNVNVRAEYV